MAVVVAVAMLVAVAVAVATLSLVCRCNQHVNAGGIVIGKCFGCYFAVEPNSSFWEFLPKCSKSRTKNIGMQLALETVEKPPYYFNLKY